MTMRMEISREIRRDEQLSQTKNSLLDQQQQVTRIDKYQPCNLSLEQILNYQSCKKTQIRKIKIVHFVSFIPQGTLRHKLGQAGF